MRLALSKKFCNRNTVFCLLSEFKEDLELTKEAFLELAKDVELPAKATEVCFEMFTEEY